MDPVDVIRRDVQIRVRALGTEIIRFSETKKRTSRSSDLSDADKTEKVSAAKERLKQNLDAAFGEGEASIKAGILLVLKDSAGAERERAQAAADVWISELPDLRRFIEYCAEMIEADIGTREATKGRRCLTETSVVLDQIATRVEGAVTEK